MMLIKALGKVGCKYRSNFTSNVPFMILILSSIFTAFIVNQLSEPVKSALFVQLFEILAANEFIDFILSFMQEAMQNYPGAISTGLSETVALKMTQLRDLDL